MEERFVKAVEDGLKLSKRIYAGKERPSSAVAAPPRPVAAMDRSSSSSAGLKLHHHQSHLPTAPMVYAVIGDPAIVDNPDIPSYQPHVYGRCDPPALIPLQLNEIAMDVDCFMGSALVEVRGKWRVHCVMGSRSCNCQLFVPMGEQVYSSDIFGGVLLKSPSVLDTDQREMFCLYLFPGSNHNRKIFRKEVVFIVDISGSMLGKPLENAKNALSAALIELAPADSFCIIAFNEETFSFSSYLELATKEVVENAIQWMDKNFVAGGGTNITRPLNEAMIMLSNARDSIPHIFLITDGAVEDEHSIEIRMQRLCSRALSTVLANINVDVFDHVDEFEVYPFNFPDLSNRSPLVVSGRYRGHIPDSCKASGTLSDLTDFVTELKVRRTEVLPLNKVLVKQHIDLLTSQAWFSESKLQEEKVTKLSLQYGVPSEYTFMVLMHIDKEKNATEQAANKIDLQKYSDPKNGKITLIQASRIGFGDVTATIENIPAGYGEAKPPEAAEVLIKAVSCCNRIADCCCCMCCIQICNKMNDQCVTTLTQLCTALSCFACVECCADVCCGSD
ncbi:hypothetical protein QJS10_CPB12g01809 [Acorus calamus]|uniref:VWFA domain-containing protein n=1 Tax=Acorus calamus TaxID=4465 RepID=A0AAV9DLP1_ACOCL|nr:hypothetical protein QJS10_CPB12g01809 [Acorus calamus]